MRPQIKLGNRCLDVEYRTRFFEKVNNRRIFFRRFCVLQQHAAHRYLPAFDFVFVFDGNGNAFKIASISCAVSAFGFFRRLNRLLKMPVRNAVDAGVIPLDPSDLSLQEINRGKHPRFETSDCLGGVELC